MVVFKRCSEMLQGSTEEPPGSPWGCRSVVSKSLEECFSPALNRAVLGFSVLSVRSLGKILFEVQVFLLKKMFEEITNFPCSQIILNIAFSVFLSFVNSWNFGNVRWKSLSWVWEQCLLTMRSLPEMTMKVMQKSREGKAFTVNVKPGREPEIRAQISSPRFSAPSFLIPMLWSLL